ncbi:MAG: TonB family protein [Alphaproteobacteria bacterium]|nr:TonB family protein [Alphaproteobacteria bacterium]
MQLPAGFRGGRVVSGLIAAVVGSIGTGVVLVAMNGGLMPPKPPPQAVAVAFDPVEKVKPPPDRPKPKPKPEKRTPSPRPPMPALTAGLAGLDFGLPQFQGGLDEATDALIGEVGDVVMTAETVDAPPRPVDVVQPEYPVRARADAITGYVTLSVLVDEQGNVSDLRILEARPPGVFDNAALNAVRQWHFRPATYEGRAVSVRATQTLRFELE